MTEVSTGDKDLVSETPTSTALCAESITQHSPTDTPPLRVTITAPECLLLAGVPVLAGGFPRGPYLTIFSAIALYIIVQLRHRSDRPFNPFERALLYAVGLTAICAAWVSNHLMIAMIELVIYGSFFYNLTVALKPIGASLTELRLFLNALGACGTCMRHVFNPTVWCHFRPRNVPIPSRVTVASLCILSVILIIFHLLLMQVNTEYADFVHHLLRNILLFLQQIISLRFVIELACLFLLGTGIFAMINRSRFIDLAAPSEQLKSLSMDLILGGVVGLLALFSWFQSHAVFRGSLEKNFGAFSRYTQGGFWQLLIVAALGYILTQATAWIAAARGVTSPRLRVLVLVLLGELSLLGAFSGHKLGLLQWSFGLKDQRILASFAVCLILLATVGRFVTFLRRSETPLLRPQIGTLVGGVALLSLINVETTMTSVYPIRYFVAETPYLDYSYLLTNSNDNYTRWPDLIDQATKQGKIPAPRDYYWGQYRPICSFQGYGIHVPLEEQLEILRYHHSFMAAGEFGRWGRRLLNTPINTHSAAALATDRQEEFQRFIEHVKATCEG